MDNTERNETQADRNENIVKKVKKFFDDRTSRQRFEMNKLIELTALTIQNFSDKNLKSNVEKALDEDIKKVLDLNLLASVDDPYPFRYNKLLDLLTQSKTYINSNWEYIHIGNSKKLLNRSSGISWEGTSMLNYMQTSMLEILSVIYEESITDLKCLKEAGNIYQIETSPNIQSILVSYKNDSSSRLKFEHLNGWRWACKKDSNPFKLVTPSLGYAYGGSRFDNDFVNKLFKLHDCSSFVGEFLNLKLFTTNSLKMLIELERKAELKQNDNINLVKNVLRYKGSNGEPEAGNVFLVKSHCGFVIEINNEKNCLKTCEFTRFIPLSEGLVLNNCKLNENGKWIKETENQLNDEELLRFVDKTNENTSALPAEPAQMYFFEVIQNV